MDSTIYEFSFLLLSVIGLVAVPLARFSRNTSNLLPPGKKVGASYWGVYSGAPTSEPEALKTIAVRQPSFSELVVAGSGVYASGKAVKSLRR